MLSRCLDGRIRGLLKYHGASLVDGRANWSASELPRGSLNIDQAPTVMQKTHLLLKSSTAPVEVGSLLRRCLFQQKGSPCGCRLFLNRSKSVAWLAGEKSFDAFQMVRRLPINGVTIYKSKRSSVQMQRQVGKMAVLGAVTQWVRSVSENVLRQESH